MLPISIELNHTVITMIDGIPGRGLETNSQATVNWHINHSTMELVAYIKS